MSTVNQIKHITAYTTPNESPGYLLWRVSLAWRSAIEAGLKPFGLTHPQFVVLATLSWLTRDGAVVSQIDVGRLAGLDPNNTSHIMRGLEKKRLIQRALLKDERSKNPTVTQQGMTLLAHVMPAVEKIDAAYFAVFNEKEMNAAVSLLQRLMHQ